MNRNMEPSHIMVKIPDDFPEELVEKITSGIKTDNLILKVRKVPNEPMMAVELTIPALIAIFIAQSYFGGFIKEMGKDHYLLLKNWLTKTALNSRGINVQIISANQSTEKINQENTQSNAFSLHLQTLDNRHIKLLFDLNLDNEIWESSIDKIVDLIQDNYENYPNDELTKKITALNTHRPHIYGIINPETTEWDFFDHMMLFSRQYGQNKNRDL